MSITGGSLLQNVFIIGSCPLWLGVHYRRVNVTKYVHYRQLPLWPGVHDRMVTVIKMCPLLVVAHYGQVFLIEGLLLQQMFITGSCPLWPLWSGVHYRKVTVLYNRCCSVHLLSKSNDHLRKSPDCERTCVVS